MEQGMTTETHRSTRRYRQPDGCTPWPRTSHRSAPAIQIVSYRISPNAGKKPETGTRPETRRPKLIDRLLPVIRHLKGNKGRSWQEMGVKRHQIKHAFSEVHQWITEQVERAVREKWLAESTGNSLLIPTLRMGMGRTTSGNASI
jgi:hypothetical protein